MNPPKSYYSQESERLSYRSLTKDDINLWLPFFEKNPALRFLGMDSEYFKHLSDIEKASKWINRQMEREANGEFGQLAVVEKASGAMIGLGGIIYRNEDGIENDFEVTYSLLPNSHGKGYGTELAVHFKEFGLKHTGNKTMISIIHQENIPSIRVAEKNGMVQDGALDSYMDMPIFIYRTK